MPLRSVVECDAALLFIECEHSLDDAVFEEEGVCDENAPGPLARQCEKHSRRGHRHVLGGVFGALLKVKAVLTLIDSCSLRFPFDAHPQITHDSC